jgi:hypothetical protein
MFIAVGLGGCTSGGGAQAPSRPAQSTCAAVSDLVVYSYTDAQFTGYALAKAWHVWFSDFGPVRSGKALLADYTAEWGTKVVIHPDPDLKQAVVLSGIECSTQAPLHFCYEGCSLETGKKYSPDELARAGPDSMTIMPSSNSDYHGYILFPRPGKYRLSVRSGADELGSVTLGVPG